MNRLPCKQPQIQKPSNQESRYVEFLILPPSMQDPTTPANISHNCTPYSIPSHHQGLPTYYSNTYQSKHAISQKTWIFNYDIWRSWFLWASAQDIEKAEHLEELVGVCWFQLGKNFAKFHRDNACWKLLVTTHQLNVTKLPKLRHAMNNVFASCDTYVSQIKTFAAPHENMISKTPILTAQHWTKTRGP